MASHQGSRKRIKMSPTESKPTPSIMAHPIASTSTSSNAGQSTAQHACGHEASLKALQTDVDAMRQIVTCKICQRLLYEPYSLACGHTYCYSCLSQWLVDGRKKTCPDCRAVVNQQPTPSYLVRELVLVFVSRNELLPDGETTDEHNTYVKQEAEVVAKDKANTDQVLGGLFKGCFKRGIRGYIGSIHDPHDGVDRCPTCHWELEDGFCNSCGVMVDPHEHLGFSDYDDDSDLTEDELELDHELDADDVDAVFGADGQDDYFDNSSVFSEVEITSRSRGRQINHRFPGSRGSPRISSASQNNRDRVLIDIRSSDESEADDEDETNLPGFIVDDDNVEYASSDEGEGSDVSVRGPHVRRRVPMVVVSEDERPTSSAAEPTSGSDDQSEDEGPVVRGSHRYKREESAGRLQRGRRTISSDEESSENEDDQESVVPNDGGFSPLATVAQYWQSSPVNSGYDSDGVSTVHPMDDDDGYEGHTYRDENDDDESDESDSETGWGTQHETPVTSRPAPSTSSHRLHNLGTHRNRYSDAIFDTATTTVPPSFHEHHRSHFSAREPYSNQQPVRDRSNQRFQESLSTHPPYGHSRHSVGFPGMFRPRPERMGLPSHPFQLDNILHDVNNRTSSLNSNYNQRNDYLRSNPAHRTLSSTSDHGSAIGGVDVHGSNSSGSSSSTLRSAPTSSRRKRNLSISSDNSTDEFRRHYA